MNGTCKTGCKTADPVSAKSWRPRPELNRGKRFCRPDESPINQSLVCKTSEIAPVSDQGLTGILENAGPPILPLVAAARERDRRARERLSRDPDFVFGRGPFRREWP